MNHPDPAVVGLMDDELIDKRVRICDRAHPHYGETGKLIGNTIWVAGALMTELRLENCQHSTRACFVGKGQVELCR